MSSTRYKVLPGVMGAGLVCLMMQGSLIVRAGEAGGSTTLPLTLDQYRQMVILRNETIQGQMLGAEAARRRAKGEYGKFEPDLVGSVDHVADDRPNTVEQQRTLNGVPVFSERNWNYDLGIESLVPTGGKVRLGYTMRYLRNNLQGMPSLLGSTTGPEYQSFFGATLTQPLLKNAGVDASMAGIRVAALGSSVAFQEYRRQYAVIISTAEATYWKLYYAQEQLRFLNEAVGFAETVEKDSESIFKSGRGSELDVLEARSGLALRKTKQSEAMQKLYDIQSQVVTLYDGSAKSGAVRVVALDSPNFAGKESTRSYAERWNNCLTLNPDILIQQKKLDIEDVRLRYAKNQRWPEVNLKAAYGLNGLGSNMGDSWSDVSGSQFPAWSVGVECRLPLGGGIKPGNDLYAAKLSRDQAKLSLDNTENQVANALSTAMPKIQTTEEIVHNYESIEQVNQQVLGSQVERLKLGKIEPRKVLESEADLFEARAGLADALVQHELAFLELEIVEGSTLKNRNLDLTQEQLREKTEVLLANRKVIKSQSSQIGNKSGNTVGLSTRPAHGGHSTPNNQ